MWNEKKALKGLENLTHSLTLFLSVLAKKFDLKTVGFLCFWSFHETMTDSVFFPLLLSFTYQLTATFFHHHHLVWGKNDVNFFLKKYGKRLCFNPFFKLKVCKGVRKCGTNNNKIIKPLCSEHFSAWDSWNFLTKTP